MENHFLIGTKNNGCFIDNNAHIIEYYERLNLPEKLSKKDPCTTIKYENITKIQVTYAISEGIGFGVITLHLIIETKTKDEKGIQDHICAHSHTVCNKWRPAVSGCRVKTG